MSFHNVTLPHFVSLCAIGSPFFQTSIAQSFSGREVRSSDYSSYRQIYKIQNCKISVMQFHQFNSFFKARAGKRFSFRFKDFADYKVENQIIKKGAGEIGLHKLYEDPISTYVRKITKPKTQSVRLFTDGQETRDYELDENTGIVKLTKDLLEHQILTASFEFDVQVRFAKDNFSYAFCHDGSVELLEVELIEVTE